MIETLSYAVPSASRIMLSLPAKEPVETMTALALTVSWLPSSLVHTAPTTAPASSVSSWVAVVFQRISTPFLSRYSWKWTNGWVLFQR